MTLKERKTITFSKLENRVWERVRNLLEPTLAVINNRIDQVSESVDSVEGDFNTARYEVENTLNTLSDHVDELESEFRHEVHEVQDKVNDYDSSEDHILQVVNDYVSHSQMEDQLDLNNNTEFTELKEEVEKLTSAFSDIGDAVRYL